MLSWCYLKQRGAMSGMGSRPGETNLVQPRGQGGLPSGMAMQPWWTGSGLGAVSPAVMTPGSGAGISLSSNPLGGGGATKGSRLSSSTEYRPAPETQVYRGGGRSTAMPPPFRGWADLPSELLHSIAQLLDGLNCYAGARGACTAWRRALAPPTPSLLLVPDDDSRRPSAASFPTDRFFKLSSFPSGAHCVGSTNGWLALAFSLRSSLSLFNPVTAAEIVLPPLLWDLPSKIVFAPDPARDDFAAAAVCGTDRLAYVTAGARP